MKTQLFRARVIERMAETNFTPLSICHKMAEDYIGEIEWHRITGKSVDLTANIVLAKAVNGSAPIEFDVFEMQA